MQQINILTIVCLMALLTACQQKEYTVDNLEMVEIEGGGFRMGCIEEEERDCKEEVLPQHYVELSDFAIGKYEVTQGQWQEIMEENPSGHPNCLNCPVERVSWEEVQLFIERLNKRTGLVYRLPTEAEWEYAARGGKKTNWRFYAGSDAIDRVA